jgi:uracil-DNA glycosylase
MNLIIKLGEYSLITSSNCSERVLRKLFLSYGEPSPLKKAGLLGGKRNRIIAAPHRSPLSAHRSFFGNRPFSKINDYPTEIGKTAIEWQIPDL